MPTHPVLICADDFGISPAVSRGILELARANRLSGTSCMMVCPATAGHAAELLDESGRVDIGVHLTLTDFQPLERLPSLAPAGRLPGVARLLGAALRRSLPLDEVEREARSQLQAFEDCFGRRPAFIDGHHHVQQLPGIGEIVLRLATERAGSAAPCVRNAAERWSTIGHRGVARRKALLIGWFGARFKRQALGAGSRTNDGFTGIYDFSPRRPYAWCFDRFLRETRPGTLVMCHPGRVDAALRAVDGVTDQRERELEFLLSDEYPELLERRGLGLGRFADVI